MPDQEGGNMGNGLDNTVAGPTSEQRVERGWKETELDLVLKDQQRKLEGM